MAGQRERALVYLQQAASLAPVMSTQCQVGLFGDAFFYLLTCLYWSYLLIDGVLQHVNIL